MDFLFRIIPLTLIAISIFLIRIYMMNKSTKELLKTWQQEHVVLRFPSIFFWIGFLDVFFFSACLFIMFFFPNGTEAWWTWIGCILFLLPGFYLMSYVLLFKIDVYRSKDYFVYRNLFSRTRKIYYHECVSYQCTEHDLIVKTGKKKITIDIHTINVEVLMGMLGKNKVRQIR